MKFIKLESRGGNYLVVASNAAWLRSAENGQTNVGIVGGQSLLVVGSIEEVAETILKGLSATADEQAVEIPMSGQGSNHASAAPRTNSRGSEPEPQPDAAKMQPSPAVEADLEPDGAAESPEPVAAGAAPRHPPASSGSGRPRVASARSASQWERPASGTPKSLKIKSSSQRMMGMLE
jgi:hypothetical protein